MVGGTHFVLSVSLNPYPQASAWVPILRKCLRVSTQQYSQSNTVLIVYRFRNRNKQIYQIYDSVISQF